MDNQEIIEIIYEKRNIGDRDRNEYKNYTEIIKKYAEVKNKWLNDTHRQIEELQRRNNVGEMLTQIKTMIEQDYTRLKNPE